MGFLAILGCGAVFAFKSALGLIFSVPAWLAFLVLFKRLRASRNDAAKSIVRVGAGAAATLAVAMPVTFFATLDFSKLHSGAFDCPPVTHFGAYGWPVAIALTLSGACWAGLPSDVRAAPREPRV